MIRILLITLILLAKPALAVDYQLKSQKKLELATIINSALAHYPKVLAIYQEVEAAKGSVLANKGFFDVKLRQEYVNKTRGYYDGSFSDTSISKQNQFLGSEISLGYRKSFKDFENHETSHITNNDGELYLKGKFSLLRNAMIDESRLSLILARLDLNERKQALRNIKNQIKFDATKAYYDWIKAGKIYQSYRELYNLALKRNKQVAIRVKKGDLAEITLTENRRNLLSRKSAMIRALQQFQNNAIYLSLFYRDKSGSPIIISSSQMPEINISQELSSLTISQIDRDLVDAMQNRADMQIIKIARQKENANLKQAQNLYKPKLDLNVKLSNDISNENQPRGQSKNEIGLNFSLPLQQRKAKGAIAKAKAKISKIKYQQQLLRDSIKVSLAQISNSINATAKMHDNLIQEFRLSKRLEKAENKRFKKGGSDFFLINLREQQSLNAKILAIKTYADYFKFQALYDAEVFRE